MNNLGYFGCFWSLRVFHLPVLVSLSVSQTNCYLMHLTSVTSWENKQTKNYHVIQLIGKSSLELFFSPVKFTDIHLLWSLWRSIEAFPPRAFECTSFADTETFNVNFSRGLEGAHVTETVETCPSSLRSLEQSFGFRMKGSGRNERKEFWFSDFNITAL